MRSTAAYSINTLIGPLFTIVFTPIYIRVLTQSDLGTVALVRTLGMIVSVFGTLGLATAMGVLLHDQPDDEAQMRMLSTAIWLGTGFSAMLVFAGVLLQAPLARIWLGNVQFATVVALYLINLPFGALYSLYVGALRLRQEAWRASLLGVVQVVLLAVFSLSLVVWLRLGVVGVLGAEVLTYTCLSALCIMLAPRYFFALPRALWERWQPLLLARQLLLTGLPLVPSGLAVWALGYVDRPILQQMGIDLATIGVYDVANKLASMVALVSVPFQAAWTPFALAIQNQPNAPRVYARILTYYMAGMLGVALALGLFAREILLVFATPDYLEAHRFVWLLAYAAPIQGSTIILAIGLYLSKRTVHLAWTATVGAAVNIGLNLLLVPRLGVLGAAIATPLGYLCGPVATYVVAQRARPIPYDLPRLALALGTQFVLVVVGLQWSAATTPLTIGIRAALLLVYPLLLILFGVISRAEFEQARAWLRWRWGARRGARNATNE